jgi:hypothetical protein
VNSDDQTYSAYVDVITIAGDDDVSEDESDELLQAALMASMQDESKYRFVFA